MKSPRRHPRLIAAVLISVLSIALAEVTIGSYPWALLNPLNWLLMVPVYGCQVLLIAALVLRRQPRPSLPALWSAGAVVGLYEFYITRTLWGHHDWNTPDVMAGVDVYAVVVVAGLWHPFMAFIFPLMLAEQVLVREPHIAGLFARRGRAGGAPKAAMVTWAGIAAAGIVSGGFLGLLASPVVAAGSLGGTALLVWCAFWLAGRGERAENWADVLPNRAGMVALIAVLAVLYGLFAWRVYPGEPIAISHQAMAWGLYAAFVWLTVRNLREPVPTRVVRFAGPQAWRLRVASYVGVAVLVALIPYSLVAGVFVIWVLGAAVALWMFGWSVRGAVRRNAPTTTVA
ncbi:MAG: hypothetical protein CVT64_10670 [Actinobacteria bacterium HGW-Actinobacteria-4]|nr:MAG: hypothetical protein CVT64_10670 [Actinobacteria bacterium HGW-Actinobacteria-4]